MNILLGENFFDKIIGRNEIIRFMDKGNERYIISQRIYQTFNMIYCLDKMDFLECRFKEKMSFLLRAPLITDSFSGTIEIGTNVETFDSFMEKVIWVLMLGTILSLGLSLISGRILAGKLVSPLRGLTDTMKKIEDQQFQERVPETDTRDEFSQLSSIFNSMMDKVEQSFQQQKRFVEDASHELRTPLAIIHGHLSLLQRWGKKDMKVLENSLKTSIKETNRMIDLTNELLLLSRVIKKEDHRSYNPCLALETLDEVIDNYQFLHKDLIINNQSIKNEDVLLVIPQEQLKQVLIIIFDNAIKYSGDKKEITLITSEVDGKYKIEIQDNGFGISEEDLPYIFDRFYRVDKARSRSKGGNGLGLSIAKKIIEECNGQIKVESTRGKGTTVILLFDYAF